MDPQTTSIRQAFEEDKEYMLRFRRVLVKPDQPLIDELIGYAEKHMYPAANARHPLPFLMALVGMVVEHQKKIRKLEEALYALQARKEE